MSTTTRTSTHSAEYESVSEAVITAVATSTNRDPTEIETLYSVIDPDSLDDLFRDYGSTNRNRGEVRFHFDGCDVTVFADGTVNVEVVTDELY